MKSVFVVVGVSGEYPYLEEWLMCAFAAKAEADAFCDRLTAEWEERSSPREGEDRYDAIRRARVEMRQHLGALCEGAIRYDTPSWYVVEVPWGES